MNVTKNPSNNTYLSIIIPAHNEAERIETTLKNYAKFFSVYRKNNFEILVILNGCTDNTESVVSKYQKQYPEITYYTFKNKLGKGGAIIEGFKLAKGNLVGFVDADYMIDENNTNKVLKNLENCDLSIGMRLDDKSKLSDDRPFARIIISKLIKLLTKKTLRLRYTDTQCPAKFFKKDKLDLILPEITTTSWAFDIDLLVLAEKHRLIIKETAISWKHAKGSKVQIILDLPQEIKNFFHILFKRLRN